MAYGQTGLLELLNDKDNEKRSNMIGALSTLYKTFEMSGVNSKVLSFENYTIIYRDGILEIVGCIDEVKVVGPKYSDVYLGGNITTYGQIPYRWIECYTGRSCVE